MSQNSTIRPAACAAVAPLLPLAGHDLLSDHDAAKLREHLATCADCRADLAIYDRVEAAWRRAFAPGQTGEAFISQAALLASINDESDVAAAQPAKEAKASRPPTLPDAPRSRPRRFVAGVSVLAACLLIAGVVRAALKAGPPYQNISDSHFTDISMISDNEGWAIGGTYVAIYNHTSDPGTLYEKPLLWHYLNGTWSPVQLAIHGQLTSISMDSPTDGWAIGQDAYGQAGAQVLLLHYNGQSWMQIPAPQGMWPQMLQQVLILSPTNGWIVGVANPVFPGESQTFQSTGIWHYDGQTWKAVPLPASLNESLQKGDTFQVSSISMISATEGWAVATLVPGEQIPPSPTPVPTVGPDSLSPSGVILHYTGGQWTVQQILPKTYLQTISMLSSTNGWLGGQNDTSSTTTDPNSPTGTVQQEKTSPLLLHYINGQWVNATSSVNVNPSAIETFLQLFLRSATDGWMAFLPANLQNDTPTLLHYNGSQWNLVHLPTIKNTGSYFVSRVFLTSAAEGWAMGSREVKSSSVYTLLRVPVIYHLHNDVWSVAQS